MVAFLLGFIIVVLIGGIIIGLIGLVFELISTIFEDLF